MSEEEQQWYFISVVDQEQYGPYTADQLQDLVAKGSITRETMIWTAALEDQWIPATNVEGLFPSTIAPPRPQLLTGAAAQSARPLGAAPIHTPVQAAPVQAAPLQAAPLQAAPLQAAPQQPVYQQPQQQVAPGMIPSSMPGTVQAAPVQASPYATPTAGFGSSAAVPAGGPFPAPGPVSASFGRLVGLICAMFGLTVMIVIGVLMAIGSAATKGSGLSSSEMMGALMGAGAIVIIGALLILICYIFYLVSVLMYVHRIWRVIQPGAVRTTPAKAVGFLFIPFFNLYYVFITYVGLAKDWNRVMSSYSNLMHAPRLSPGLMTTYAILWVIWFIGFFSGLITIDANPAAEAQSTPLDFLFAISNLAKLVIELIVFAGICKAINFMGRLHMMPGAGMGGGVPGHPAQPLGGTAPQPGGIRLY